MGKTVENPFRVLYVCTGNLCRSPMAERMLRHELAHRWGPDAAHWHVGSAGVHAGNGNAMDAKALRVLSERGMDGTQFGSRKITPDLIRGVDLILTAERSHRSAAVAMVPGAVGYTFTMRQFARLARSVPLAPVRPVDAGPHLLSHVLAARGRVQPINPAEEDVQDPIGRPLRTFRKCGDIIQESVNDLLSPFGRH